MYRHSPRPLMLVLSPAWTRISDVTGLCRVFSIGRPKRRCCGDSAARIAAHRKALLRTVGDVMSGRVKSQ